MKNLKTLMWLLVAVLLISGSCEKDPYPRKFLTRHVIVIVVDGPRFSETWDYQGRQLIPFRNTMMRPEGTMLTNFRNEGFTWTSAGHGAVSTGVYEDLNNGGAELPTFPGFMHYWRKYTHAPAEKAWVVASKDKLYVLADSKDTTMRVWNPSYNCGVNGPYTGYREDSVTFRIVKEKLTQHHPDLMLVNFKEPDASGHSGNWNNYLNGVVSTDSYVYQIWQYLQQDPYYAGTTTLIITNDHGRHLDNVLDGFVSHGDNCEGCRHIEFLALGPDIKKGFESDVHYEQIDIPKTIGALMAFPVPTGNGRVMQRILKEED
ncbi:MAG: hypothetical protein Fur0041_06690 [Bacteroidia bacterium]